MDYLNIILIFSAVTLSFYLAVTMFFKVSLESLEKRKNKNYEVARRFIKPEQLLKIRICSGILSGAFLLLILIYCNVQNPWIYITCSLIFGTAAYFAPMLYFLYKEKQRKEAFESKLLDLTITLASGMRSGLALAQALEAAAQRIGDPMKEELGIVLKEYRLGLELADALERLNQRMPCEDLHLLVTSIRLSVKSGGSLVDVLEEMINTIRSRTEFQERLKNMTAQGKFEALAMSLSPVAAFIMLYIIDPVLMTPMVTTGTGWSAIGVIAALIAVGFTVINKIVSVEV